MLDQESGKFIDLHYNGRRFDGGRLPVDVLNDLLVFREVVLEIAKNIWREQNPARKRLPRGFDEFFRLNLSEIKDGSAIATLTREEADLTPLFEDGQIYDIFDEAQGVVIDGLIAANDNQPIKNISDQILARLGAIGKRLQKHEDITFEPKQILGGPVRQAAKLSMSTRERIFKQAGLDVERHIESFGILSGCDESASTITIISELGRFVAKVPKEKIRGVYDGRIGSVVEYALEANISSKGKIRKVGELHYADLIDDGPTFLEVQRRFGEFKELKAGWFDGDGDAFDEKTLSMSEDLSRFINASYESVRVYPMPDSSIRIEFDRGCLDNSIQVFPDGKVFLHSWNVETDRDFESVYSGLTESLLADLLNLSERFDV